MTRGKHAIGSSTRSVRISTFLVVLVVVIVGAAGVFQSLPHARATNVSGSHHVTSMHRTIRAVRRTVGPIPATVCAAGQCPAWRPVDTWAHATPVYLMTVHADGTPAGNVGYAAWFRSSSVDVGLYPGYQGPGVTALNRGPEEVPLTGRANLLATFNSGFYEKDGPAGFFTNHTLYFPMVAGEATLLRYSNGRLAIETWPGGTLPRNVVMARQNLTLLVSGGHATPQSANNAQWGSTLHGVPAVWRSAIGLDRMGNLIYAAADQETSASLASLMIELHCVVAMQLDINPEWPAIITYAAPGAIGPTLDNANPNQIAGRFLYTSTKDFFAVYLSHHPGEATPW